MSDQAPLSETYLDQMLAHVEESGKLNHQNAVDLLFEVMRLRGVVADLSRAHD